MFILCEVHQRQYQSIRKINSVVYDSCLNLIVTQFLPRSNPPNFPPFPSTILSLVSVSPLPCPSLSCFLDMYLSSLSLEYRTSPPPRPTQPLLPRWEPKINIFYYVNNSYCISDDNKTSHVGLM